jgi:hypothetical protein
MIAIDCDKLCAHTVMPEQPLKMLNKGYTPEDIRGGKPK